MTGTSARCVDAGHGPERMVLAQRTLFYIYHISFAVVFASFL